MAARKLKVKKNSTLLIGAIFSTIMSGTVILFDILYLNDSFYSSEYEKVLAIFFVLPIILPLISILISFIVAPLEIFTSWILFKSNKLIWLIINIIFLLLTFFSGLILIAFTVFEFAILFLLCELVVFILKIVGYVKQRKMIKEN